MWSVITGVVGDVIKSVVDSDNNREIAIRKSNNQRNVEIAKTIVNGAVTAYGIYAQTQQGRPQVVGNIASQNYIESGRNIPLIASQEPEYKIDHSSIWVNKQAGEMGANLVEVSTGNVAAISYRMQGLGNKVYKVFMQVGNDGWGEVGIIDWNRIDISDLENATDPFFAEIMRAVM